METPQSAENIPDRRFWLSALAVVLLAIGSEKLFQYKSVPEVPVGTELVRDHVYKYGRNEVRWPILITADQDATILRFGACNRHPQNLTSAQAVSYSEAAALELKKWAEREHVTVLSTKPEETLTFWGDPAGSPITLTYLIEVDRGKQ